MGRKTRVCKVCHRVIEFTTRRKPDTWKQKSFVNREQVWWNEEKTICYSCGKPGGLKFVKDKIKDKE
mgnify:CR=1 FL=1